MQRLKLSENQRLELNDQLMSVKKELAEAKVAAGKDKQVTKTNCEALFIIIIIT